MAYYDDQDITASDAEELDDAKDEEFRTVINRAHEWADAADREFCCDGCLLAAYVEQNGVLLLHVDDGMLRCVDADQEAERSEAEWRAWVHADPVAAGVFADGDEF